MPGDFQLVSPTRLPVLLHALLHGPALIHHLILTFGAQLSFATAGVRRSQGSPAGPLFGDMKAWGACTIKSDADLTPSMPGLV
jgi:hypothetical protein